VPIFMVHGTRDASVPVESADAIAAEFRRLGKRNLVYRRLDGLDHGWRDVAGGAHVREVLKEVGTWLGSVVEQETGLATPQRCSRTAPRVEQPRPARLAPNVRDISADLEPIRAKGEVPALAAAEWRGGELLAIGATGVRTEGDVARVTTDDPWHLGSDTKAMTAVLVAIWIDRGKLRFDETLGELFGTGVHPGYRAVTVEQLLQHRGGLPHQFPSDIWKDMWRGGGDPKARAAAIQALLSRPPMQKPGTFQYANSGYVTLGEALERVTGQRWEDLIRTDLFAPLGMASCGFGAPEGRVPSGHRRAWWGAWKPVTGELADNPPANAPAGGVYCILRDWGKFLALVLAGARGEHVALVADATMKRLLTPPLDAKEDERYAGGWLFLTRSWANGLVLTHSGSNTLWLVAAWLAPRKNLAFAAAANAYEPRTVDSAFSTMIPVYAK